MLATLVPAAPAFALDNDALDSDLGSADEVLMILGHGASANGHGKPHPTGQQAGNTAAINQHGNHHTATINQSGNGHYALIDQRGRGNDATISQQGYGHAAAIVQHGSANTAAIHQAGKGNGAAIVQRGNGNSAHIGQMSSGLHLDVVQQIGNGQTFSSHAAR